MRRIFALYHYHDLEISGEGLMELLRMSIRMGCWNIRLFADRSLSPCPNLSTGHERYLGWAERSLSGRGVRADQRRYFCYGSDCPAIWRRSGLRVVRNGWFIAGQFLKRAVLPKRQR